MLLGFDDTVGIEGNLTVLYSSYWMYNNRLNSDDDLAAIAGYSKLPILKPTLLMVKFDAADVTDDYYPGYVGISRMKGLESARGAAGLDDRYVGVGGNTGEMTSLTLFDSSGESAFAGESDCWVNNGYGEVAVYIDPWEGECWLAPGRDGFIDSPNNCIGGGDPTLGTTPTFTWTPGDYIWYLDVRSSADMVWGGAEYEVPPVYIGSRGDDDGTYAGVDMETWDLPTDWTLGLWSRVPDVLSTTGVGVIEALDIDNVGVETGVIFPFGTGEMTDQPPYITGELVLRAFGIESTFGVKASLELQAFVVDAVGVKDILANCAFTMKGFQVEAVIGQGRFVNATFSMAGFQFSAEVSKDKLVSGSLMLKALSHDAVAYQVSTSDTVLSLSPFELNARGLLALDHFVLRYTR